MRPSKRQEDGIKATDADWFLHKMKRTTAVPFQLQANREAFRRKNELPITRRLDEAMRVEKNNSLDGRELSPVNNIV